MYPSSPLDYLTKTMTQSAEPFSPAVMQVVVKNSQNNLKAWIDLVQTQVQAAQTAAAKNFATFNGVKEPQAALDAMKASAEQGIAIATQNLKDITALAVAQFKANIEAIEKVHPAPEAFASLAQSLKDAAASLESTLDAALTNGTEAQNPSAATDAVTKTPRKKAGSA